MKCGVLQCREHRIASQSSKMAVVLFEGKEK